MDAAEYQNIFDHEDEHFYYVAVHEAVENAVQRVISERGASDEPLRILDAGCGTGWLAARLSRYGQVNAIDVYEQALTLARSKKVDAQWSTVEEIPFRDNTFDIVTSIDVIYHRAVADDMKALGEMFRVLKPGGSLIIRVPAHRELYSSHDKYVQTARRYTEAELADKLGRSCFRVRQSSYCQASLFLPALVKARLESMRGAEAHSTIGAPGSFVNSVLTSILRAENRLLERGWKLPAGIGVFAIATKPQGTKNTLRNLVKASAAAPAK